MNKVEERTAKLQAVSKCLADPRTSDEKTLTYEKERIAACIQVIADVIQLDNVFKG